MQTVKFVQDVQKALLAIVYCFGLTSLLHRRGAGAIQRQGFRWLQVIAIPSREQNACIRNSEVVGRIPVPPRALYG